MYNKVNCAQNQCIMLKSYIPGVDSWIGAKRCYNNSFYGNLVNELHNWIENHHSVIQYPNISELICIKTNVNMLKKQK